LDQVLKCGFIVQCDIGQHLAVKIHSGGFDAMKELAVRNAGIAARGVDSDDPQGTVIALLYFAAFVGELESALDSLLRRTVQLALG